MNTENFALRVLKVVYSQGDGYYQSETENYWSAFFTNDYPMQHGNGWKLSINKKNYSFTASKGVIKSYGDTIQKTIDDLRRKEENCQ